jgi:hypothetical protein
VVGAVLIVLGGIIEVSGSSSVGTVVALIGFVLILKFRVLPARRKRDQENDP